MMVIDAGGGTVDITVYSVTRTSPWRPWQEAVEPSGKPD